MKVHFIVSGGDINLVIGNENYVVSKNHVANAQIMDYLIEHDMRETEVDADQLLTFLNVRKAIAYFSDGLIEIKDDVFHYDGQPFEDVVTEAIMKMIDEGQPVKYLVRFFEKLMLCPFPECRVAFFEWVQKFGLHITPDGDVIGYKSVQENYLDWYSSTYENTPGSSHEIDPNKVDKRNLAACGTGFHIGTLDYARTFHQHHSGVKYNIVICKFSPAGICSVEGTTFKCRVCRYFVMSLHETSEKEMPALDQPVYRQSPTIPNAIEPAPAPGFFADDESPKGQFDNPVRTFIHEEGEDDSDDGYSKSQDVL